MCSLLHLSEEELQKENVFFLQKTFEVLQQNLAKVVREFGRIGEELKGLVGRVVRNNLGLMGVSGSKNSNNNNNKSSTIPTTMSIASHTNQLNKSPNKTLYSS